MATETETGWVQCTQCGHGYSVTQSDVDAGDVTDGQTCSHCGLGLMKIDWRPRGHVEAVNGDSLIYTVTCLFLGYEDQKPVESPRPRKVEIKRSRTWGWYPTLKEATKAVLENHTDMYEMGYYNSAVIEECPPGVVAIPTNEHWFQVDYEGDDTYTVTPCEKPHDIKMIVGFAW